LCTSCEISKAKKPSTNTGTIYHNKEFVLGANNLAPGDCVSVDQYESSIRGHIPNSRGEEAFGNKYAGGTIFYDHASGLIRCIHQVSLWASDTIMAKISLNEKQGYVEFWLHLIMGIMASSNQKSSLKL
jgi:hypothetical protein